MVGESDLGGMYEDETSGTSLKKRVMGIRCPPCRVHLSILFPSSIHLGCSDSDSRHPRPMNWWHKMRRIWVSVSPRVKPRKPGAEFAAFFNFVVDGFVMGSWILMMIRIMMVYSIITLLLQALLVVKLELEMMRVVCWSCVMMSKCARIMMYR